MSQWTDYDETLDPVAKLNLPPILGAFIDGDWLTPSCPTLDIEDPGREQTIARTIDSSADVVDAAVRSADATFRGSWARVSPSDRGRILQRIAAGLRAESALLAAIETADTGKPISQSRADVETSARYFEFYAGLADKITGETLPQGSGALAYTVREPLGVVAHITPWNSPLAQMCRGIAPSLAAGNTVVVKPSELTPLSSLIACRIFLEAGLPAGACNVIPGSGPGAGAALAGHDLVQHISFTGSVTTGRIVAHVAAERIIACNLELGGKSPTIVLADADLDAAALAGASAVVRNSGQSCFATTRLLVQRSVHDQFVEKVIQRVATLRLGHGLHDPDLGPLVSRQQFERVHGYLALAREEGAHVANEVADLPYQDGPGYFVRPVILTEVDNDMRIAQEEIFGPVQSILTFDTEDEAVAIANHSQYGLAAGIFTRSLAAAHRIAGNLEAGQIQVNRYPAGGVDTPFGGYKNSGLGREKGIEATRYYTQLKTIIIDLASPKDPD